MSKAEGSAPKEIVLAANEGVAETVSIEEDDADPEHGIIVRLEQTRHSKITTHSTTMTDMSLVAADARKSIAESQYAVPAREATKQAEEKTKQTAIVAKKDTARNVLMGLCVAIALGATYAKPEAGLAAAAIIAVFGAPTIIDKLKKKASDD